jgi:hypothetical protein
MTPDASASSPGPSPSALPPPPPGLQRVTWHAVAAGLTPLIPLPILDEYALGRVRSDLVQQLLQEHGLQAPPAAVAVLAGGVEQTPGGRVAKLLKSAALAPARFVVRKVFRRLVLALWVKDCVDVASEVLHQGYLLQHALQRGDVDARALGEPARLKRVRAAIEAASREVDHRPVNQLLRRLLESSKLLVTAGSRALVAFANRNRPESAQAASAAAAAEASRPDSAESRAEVRSLSERLAAQLWEQQGYLRGLEERYARHLGAR